MHFPHENKPENLEDDFKKYKFKITFPYLIIKKNPQQFVFVF